MFRQSLEKVLKKFIKCPEKSIECPEEFKKIVQKKSLKSPKKCRNGPEKVCIMYGKCCGSETTDWHYPDFLISVLTVFSSLQGCIFFLVLSTVVLFYQSRPEAYLRQAAQPRCGPKCSRPKVNISRRALRVFEASCSPYIGEQKI